MGSAQTAADDSSSDSTSEQSDDEDRAAGRQCRSRSGKATGPRRSSSSLSSTSALSSRKSSYAGMAPSSSRVSPLCPCCSSGVFVAPKEVLYSDRPQRPQRQDQRGGSSSGSSISGSSSVEEENEEENKRRDKEENTKRVRDRKCKKGGGGRESVRRGGKGSPDHVPEATNAHQHRQKPAGSGNAGSASSSSALPKPAVISGLASLAKGADVDASSAKRSAAVSSGLEDDDDTRSVQSAFSVNTAVVAQHGGGPSARPADAASMKAALKAFVHGMAKGRELHVPGAGKELRPVVCSFTKEADALVVMDSGSRRKVLFKDMLQVHHGLEAMPLETGIACLDASVVVFELQEGDYFALHFGHAKAAEDFVLYMRLLTAIQRQQSRKLGPTSAPGASSGSGIIGVTGLDYDDARSECSVQTGIVQQQLITGPVSSASTDPKEAKRMFKMFTETMRRGRDFYVVKAGGGLCDVECSLTKSHDEFRMRWDGHMRGIPLKDIQGVHTFKDVGQLDLGFTVDERCATMEMQTGECITFKFGHKEACERFVLCMRILLEQKRPRFTTRSFDGSTGRSASGGAEMFETSRAQDGSGTRGGGASSSARTSHRAEVSGGTVAEDPKVAVELFVKQMVAGCDLNVVGPGGLTQVRCAMDTELREIALTAPDGSCRPLTLSQVKVVHVGDEARKLGLAGVSIDHLCATVELQSGDCLTFKFTSEALRDRFALCVRVFASAHQQPVR